MRTSVQVTDSEIQAYIHFCEKYAIVNDDNDPTSRSKENATVVWKYFSETWNENMTEKNLELALPQLKPYLKFWSPVEVEYNKLVVNFNDSQRDALASGLVRQGLWPADEQDQLSNWNLAAHAWLAKNPKDFENRNC